MKNLVVYKNDMNTVPLRNFTSVEMDLFFSICSKMRNEGLSKITFMFEELRELSNYKMTAIEKFCSDLESIYSKMLKLTYRYEDKDKIVMFVLFPNYEINKTHRTVTIGVNEEFKHILNKITGEFTKFELEEFTTLRSSYSKTAYRLLKQFKSTGYYVVQMDEFRRIFDVPKSYSINHITQKILKPIERELQPYFNRFRIDKIKGTGPKKRFIDKILFFFEPQDGVDQSGKRVFRDDETGEYYSKDILDFNDEEVRKAYPQVAIPVLDGQVEL